MRYLYEDENSKWREVPRKRNRRNNRGLKYPVSPATEVSLATLVKLNKVSEEINNMKLNKWSLDSL